MSPKDHNSFSETDHGIKEIYENFNEIQNNNPKKNSARYKRIQIDL